MLLFLEIHLFTIIFFLVISLTIFIISRDLYGSTLTLKIMQEKENFSLNFKFSSQNLEAMFNNSLIWSTHNPAKTHCTTSNRQTARCCKKNYTTAYKSQENERDGINFLSYLSSRIKKPFCTHEKKTNATHEKETGILSYYLLVVLINCIFAALTYWVWKNKTEIDV